MHATYGTSEHLHYWLTPPLSPCKPRYLQKSNKLSVLMRKRLSKEIGHREPYHPRYESKENEIVDEDARAASLQHVHKKGGL